MINQGLKLPGSPGIEDFRIQPFKKGLLIRQTSQAYRKKPGNPVCPGIPAALGWLSESRWTGFTKE
jgi:hypothetical protein